MGIIGIIAMHGSGRGRNGSCSVDTEGWRVFETLLLLLLLTGAVQSSRIGEVSLVLDIFPVSHLSGSSCSSVGRLDRLDMQKTASVTVG